MMTRQTKDAMNALLSFSQAMDKGVSIADLTEAMNLAIEDGHGMFEVQISMALNALRLCQEPVEA
jgi:hypothetical protein